MSPCSPNVVSESFLGN